MLELKLLRTTFAVYQVCGLKKQPTVNLHLTRLLTGLYEVEWGCVVVVVVSLAITVVKYESGSFPAIVCLIVCVSFVDVASHVVLTFSPNSCVICLILFQMSVTFQVSLTYF